MIAVSSLPMGSTMAASIPQIPFSKSFAELVEDVTNGTQEQEQVTDKRGNVTNEAQ